MNALNAISTSAIHSRFRYRCSQCDKVHVGLPDVCFPTPDSVRDLPQEEFDNSCLISEDICIGRWQQLLFVLCTRSTGYRLPGPLRLGRMVREQAGVPSSVIGRILLIRRPCGSQRPVAGLPTIWPTCPRQPAPGCEIAFRDKGSRPIVTLPPSKHRLYALQQQGLTVDQAIQQAQSGRYTPAGRLTNTIDVKAEYYRAFSTGSRPVCYAACSMRVKFAAGYCAV